MMRLIVPKDFWDSALNHRYTRILLPILLLFSLAELLHLPELINGGKKPSVTLLLVVLLIPILLYDRSRFRNTKLLSAAKSVNFYPFLSKLDQEKSAELRVPRPHLVTALSQTITGTRDRNLLIVGDSGAGKSTLISILIEQGEHQFESVSPESVHFADLTRTIAGQQNYDHDTNLSDMTDKILSTNPGETEHKALVTDYVKYALGKRSQKPTVFLFDQAERLKANLDRQGSKDRVQTRVLLDTLREDENAIVAYAVRMDKLGDLVSVLGDADCELFFVPGFDLDESFTSNNSVSRKLKNLQLTDRETERFLSYFGERDNINAFALQVAGYLVESLKPKKALEGGSSIYSDYRFYIDKYVHSIFEEFGFQEKDRTAVAEIEIVCFSLSYFNKRHQRGVTIDQLSGISHLPTSRIRKCIDFLNTKDVFEQDPTENNEIRFAHDLLIDQFLTREAEYLLPEQRVAIEQIVNDCPIEIEQGRINDYLITTLEFVDPYRNPGREDRDGIRRYCMPETILLWLVYFLYFSRIAWPGEVYSLIAPVNNWLALQQPGILVPPEQSNLFFIPIAFTQYIWVTIMFGLNWGFFSYLKEQGDIGVSYRLLTVIGPLGAFLGFFLSFAPSLFIVPIALPGTILALVYLNLWWRRKRDSTFYNYIRYLGFATIGNMAISCGVAYLMVRNVLFLNPDQFTENLGIVYVICGLFCWFAYQMRTKQGSNLGRVRMLTLYDAGRAR